LASQRMAKPINICVFGANWEWRIYMCDCFTGHFCMSRHFFLEMPSHNTLSGRAAAELLLIYLYTVLVRDRDEIKREKKKRFDPGVAGHFFVITL
jgi:hypothetical protein